MDNIQKKRKHLWNIYNEGLKELLANDIFRLPVIPDYATNNANMFYIICKNLQQRTDLMRVFAANGIASTFHYLSLHKSPYYNSKHDGRELTMADNYTDCLLRLPLYYELTDIQVDRIVKLLRIILVNLNSKLNR